MSESHRLSENYENSILVILSPSSVILNGVKNLRINSAIISYLILFENTEILHVVQNDSFRTVRGFIRGLTPAAFL